MKRWRLDSSKNCADTPQYDPRWPTIESGTPWAFMTESTEEPPCVTDYPNDCDYVRWDDAARLVGERDALAARVAELEEQLSRVVAAAEECGWNGVENSKILAEFIRGQGERLAVLEAPPIVPKGCTVRRCLDDDGKSYWDLFAGPVENDDDLVWAKERLAGYRALVWAIEHDQRPPHEGDSSHGPD